MTKTVVANHQSKTNNIVYLHDKLQKDLFRVLYELYCFSKTNYGEMIVEKTDAILAKAEVSDQLKERIFPQLVWWVIFQEPVNTDGSTIFQRFTRINSNKWRQKSAVFHQLLTSWQSISPGFYMTKSVRESERVGELVNIVGLKQYTVAVYNKVFEPLQCGELLTGFLLPIGDGVYSSPVDLFHISINDAPNVTWEVLLQYHQHTNSTNQPPSPQLYLSLITAALEVVD